MTTKTTSLATSTGTGITITVCAHYEPAGTKRLWADGDEITVATKPTATESIKIVIRKGDVVLECSCAPRPMTDAERKAYKAPMSVTHIFPGSGAGTLAPDAELVNRAIATLKAELAETDEAKQVAAHLARKAELEDIVAKAEANSAAIARRMSYGG